MGNQTGKNFISQYRAPLITLALIAAAVGVDYRLRTSDADGSVQAYKLLEQGKAREAADRFSHRLRHNPADAAARIGLGKAYQNLGWLDEAEKQFEMAAKSSSESLREAYAGLEAVALKLGRKEEASMYRKLGLERR